MDTAGVGPSSETESAAAWRLLKSGPGEPAWNMACDEALLRSSDPRPVLRLYAWRPAALSLGYFQPFEPFEALLEGRSLAVVRRPTGGGAIHHDDELTFCLVATPGQGGYPAEIPAAYRWVHDSVRRALAETGARVVYRGDGAPLSVHPRSASLCFLDTTSLDLVDEQGRKVVGSAQRRTGGRVLHHGSIPLQVPELSVGCGSVSDSAGRSVSWDELAEIFVRSFTTTLRNRPLHPEALSSEERRVAGRLAAARYADVRRNTGRRG